MMDPNQLLDSGVEKLYLIINDMQREQLLQFVALLKKWNKTYNLTAIDSTEEIITKHILDSLSVSKFLLGKNILDVGSGAGLPGVPLAILYAGKQFTLLDSNLKKTRFMQQVAIELNLQNVQVIHKRVQKYSPPINHLFSTVVSRAFANCTQFIRDCEHLIAQSRLIFMLGKQKQLEALPKSYNVEQIVSIDIPLLDAQRHIALVKKNVVT